MSESSRPAVVPRREERTTALPPAGTPRSGSLLAFFVLAFAGAWACFVSIAVFSPTGLTAGALALLGAFVPSLVAIGLTAGAAGRTGVADLLRRIVPSDVAARWYVFAAGYIVVVELLVGVIHRLALGAWPRFGTDPWYVIPFAIALSTPSQAGEEIGWRGYALPRLAARMGLRRAGLVLGVIWASWHLPLFFAQGVDKHGQSFWVYALQVTALSVAMTWLYAHVRGFLLPVMLMHASVNNAKDIVPSATPSAAGIFGFDVSPVAWITVAVLWIGAALFLARMPRAR